MKFIANKVPRWIAFIGITAIVTAPRVATAGPSCGGFVSVAPAGGDLPPAATISVFLEDRYMNGKKLGHATETTDTDTGDGALPPVGPAAKRSLVRSISGQITATIDEKPVKISYRDVVVTDGILRTLKIRSKRTGTLKLRQTNAYQSTPNELASFRVTSTWVAPVAPESIGLTGYIDSRLGPYKWIGGTSLLDFGALPVTHATLHWRARDTDKWTTVMLPMRGSTVSTEKKQVAWLGGLMCGMTRNMKPALLATGVQATFSLRLPDGSSIVTPTQTLQIDLEKLRGNAEPPQR